MAMVNTAIGSVFIVLTAIWAGATAQTDCTSVIISMSPCLNYITGNSSTPSSGCCTQLGTVVRSSPQCLCQVLNGGASSLGIQVNQTRALDLPSQCNVQTPPISRCNANSPAASPATVESPSTPSGSSSKTVPSTQTDNTSAGSFVKVSTSVFLLLAASFGSAFMAY